MLNGALYKMAMWHFLYIFSILAPILTFFSQINAFKIQTLKLYEKKSGIYVMKLHTNNMHAKFESYNFIFGCAMVKKTG